MQDVVNKTIEMTKECGSHLSTRGVPLLTSKLSSVCDILSTRADPPHVWFTFDALQESRFSEILRFGMLEIQEHLETFLDRKDQAAECLDGIKTSVKLQLLNEEDGGDSGNELVLDLGRALYKLHFQLLLLLEAAHKMLSALSNIARANKLSDISEEVSVVKAALGKAAEESLFLDRGTPTPTPSPSVSPGPILTGGPKGDDEVEAALLDLVAEGEWAAALKHARQTSAFEDEDDITGILNIYCKLLARDKPGEF